jgi:hypothetical protein
MIDTALITAVADFQQVVATTVRVIILVGLAVIIGFVIFGAVRVFRDGTLAGKESKAERMRREEWRSKMQPRTGDPFSRRQKRNAASSSTELTAKPVGTFAYPDASVRSEHINARRPKQ